MNGASNSFLKTQTQNLNVVMYKNLLDAYHHLYVCIYKLKFSISIRKPHESI